MKEKAELPNPDSMSRFEREALASGIEFVVELMKQGEDPWQVLWWPEP